MFQIATETPVIAQKIAEFSPHKGTYRLNVTNPAPIWERRCDFQGYVLKAGWKVGKPFMYVNEAQNGANKDNPNITGVNYDLVQSIANRCNFGVQLESVDKWGNLLDNGTWTGIVDKLMKTS